MCSLFDCVRVSASASVAIDINEPTEAWRFVRFYRFTVSTARLRSLIQHKHTHIKYTHKTHIHRCKSRTNTRTQILLQNLWGCVSHNYRRAFVLKVVYGKPARRAAVHFSGHSDLDDTRRRRSASPMAGTFCKQSSFFFSRMLSIIFFFLQSSSFSRTLVINYSFILKFWRICLRCN